MQKIWENNGTEEIGLVTPTPDLFGADILQGMRSDVLDWVLLHYSPQTTYHCITSGQTLRYYATGE